MAGPSFSATQNDSWAERGYPSYLLPFFRQFDALREESGDEITDQDALFRTLINPKPLQAYFAEYLAHENLHLHAHAYQSDEAQDFTKILRQILRIVMDRANGLVSDHDINNPEWIRPRDMLPFTATQIDKISQGIRDPYIVATAAVLESGIGTYFAELRAILDADFGLSSNNSIAMKNLSIGMRNQSFWTELLPLLAVTYDPGAENNNAFAQTMQTAWRNQAFQAKAPEGTIVKCPARFTVRHLMNTDFIPQNDGSLAIAKAPRDGAMLSFIYSRLRAQKHLAPLPGHKLIPLP